MNKIILALWADFLTLYNRRTLFLYLIFFGLYAFINMGAAYFILPLLFAFRPFHGEENGASVLYHSATKRKDVVWGRYLFTLSLLSFLLITESTVSMSVSIYLKQPYHLFGHALIPLIFLYLFSISVLLPAYFRFGYRKANYISIGFILLFAIAANYTPLGTELASLAQSLSNTLLVLSTLLAMLAVSLYYSIRIYNKKPL